MIARWWSLPVNYDGNGWGLTWRLFVTVIPAVVAPVMGTLAIVIVIAT